MTASVRSTARCADGTEIAFDWVYEDAPEYEWIRDRAHWPAPGTPMELWLRNQGPPGADQAWAEVRLEPPPMFHRFQMVGPFLYVRMSPASPEQMMAIAPRYMEVGREYGTPLAFWKEYCEPRIQRVCEELAAMDPAALRTTADLRELAERWFYGFHQTFTCLTLMFIANMRLSALLTEFNVADVELTAFELTQGGENATQAIDAEIWALAELARSTPAVSRMLEAGNPDSLDALRREPAAASFMSAFDDLIARHGRRSQGWQLHLETWGERPDAALALVRAQVNAERVSPDEMKARSAARRKEATERALAAIPAERHDEFRGIVQELDRYVEIREGRAYWQLVLSGAVRGLLLRIGDKLVQDGRLDDARDILYLTPDDLDGGPSVDLRARVAKARAESDRMSLLDTPPVLGTPGEVAAEAEKKRAEWRGSGASRGHVTGTARIVNSPEEGSKLQPGDILVAVMTTPAWTPLFAIAGGIVTETGGALSHPAITAREYGIPAVVALEGATTRIRDGQTITLDGSAGTVAIG